MEAAIESETILHPVSEFLNVEICSSIRIIHVYLQIICFPKDNSVCYNSTL